MRRLIVLFCLALAMTAPALAQESRAVFGPEVPKATGEPHPEGNAYMRRWHMTMMRHDRDMTVYDGDRAVNASLGECFECHTVKDDGGTPITYADDRHFCRVCHDFAAVAVDCFDCHRSTPEGFEEPAAHALRRQSIGTDPAGSGEIDRIHAFLESRSAAQVEDRK